MRTRYLMLFCLLLSSVTIGGETLKIQANGRDFDYKISGDEVNIYGSSNTIKLTGQAEEIDIYGKGNKIVVHGQVDDLDIYGSGNKVQVIGHLKEVDLRGDDNRVDCVSVSDVGFTGDSNRLKWAQGERPEVKDRGAKNTVNRRQTKK